MALNALKIQTADLVGKLVAQLSNRPTNPIAAGGDNLTAQEVKERYDAYGHLLKDRFNALVDALVADPAVDTDALANYIKVYLGDPAENDPLSLADALAALVTEIAKKYEKPEGGIPATDLAPSVTTAIDGKYEKPGTGIPATDLSTDAQTALGKADTAYQKPSGGIPASDLAEAIRTILTNAVSQSEFAPVKALAENADKVLTAANYEAVATMLNAAAKTDYKVGQKILIGAGRVPDVWIYFVHDAAVSYTFTTNLAFQTALESNTLQIGYYALRPLEAKTNLDGYATETYVGNAISGNIDATLSTTGKSADAKAVGDAIDALIDALVDGVMAVAEANYAESATYAQQADLANQINTDREIEDADTACPPVVFGTVGGNSEVTSGLMKFTELRGHTIKSNQSLLSSKSSSVDFIKRNQCPALDTFFNVLPNTEYEVSGITAGGYLQEYDADKNLIQTSSEITTTTDITITAQTVYAKIQATTYTNVLCYIKWETPNLPYVPYSKQTITLPNIELRSAGSTYDVLYQQGGGKRRIGSIDLGSLTWYYLDTADHEAMYSFGLQSLAKLPASDSTAANILCVPFTTVTRNQQYNHSSDFIIAMNDGGTLFVYSTTMGTSDADFKTAMDGVTLYYELATETDITLEENPGWTEYAEIDNFGTVKFNQDPAQTVPVPQAYFVRYTVNLVEFLDSVGERAGFDASKIALLEDIVVPDTPTTDGTYTLKVTVSSGTPTYTWVADE